MFLFLEDRLESELKDLRHYPVGEASYVMCQKIISAIGRLEDRIIQLEKKMELKNGL